MKRSKMKNHTLRPVLGFIAGFLAVLTFHQLAVALLNAAQLTGFEPSVLTRSEPFGVPVVFSLASWGGVWGVIYTFVDRKFPKGGGYWLGAILFGGIALTLVALLVVTPLKGGELGRGWDPMIWLVAFLVNAAWGLGTGVFLTLFGSARR